MGPKPFFFFSKKSRVSFEKSTEEQIGVSDTDDSVSEASMATDETGGFPDYRKGRASDGFHLNKQFFVSLTKQSNGLEDFFHNEVLLIGRLSEKVVFGCYGEAHDFSLGGQHDQFRL